IVFPALHVPALAPLGGAAGAVFRTNPAWTLIGVALLALRYRRTDGAQRRQIRWLLFGIAASLSLWIPAGALWQLADPDSTAASVAGEVAFGPGEGNTPGVGLPSCSPAWPGSPRWVRCSGRSSTPGYSASTSPCDARSSTVSCGYRLA